MYLPPRLVRSGEERSQEGTGRQVSGMGGERARDVMMGDKE